MHINTHNTPDNNANNVNSSFTIKTSKHIPSGYSLLVSHSYDKTLNKQTTYLGKDCMDAFCDDLKDKINIIY